ncbi:MAG TPA: hypothetical protein VG714_03410 [Acidobacteriaceae bacterium]|nr:hypothetical protein [Acidobacteriaceae bacterium]
MMSGSAALAQLNSNTATVTLNATLGESLTVAATPTTVNFTLVGGGVAAGSAPVAITTSWVLAAGRANVVLDAYFSDPTQALSGGSPVSYIPTSEVLGQMTTGTPTTYSAFTQTAALGSAGAGLTLFTQALNSSNRSSSRTDNLDLEIDLSAQPQLPAATYIGTLTLQAQAL